MKYFVYVDETIYCGLHGLYTQAVIEAANERDAYEVGLDLGRDFIEGYSHIYEDEEDIEFQVRVFPIHSSINLSARELDKICADMDWQDFVERFCDEEI